MVSHVQAHEASFFASQQPFNRDQIGRQQPDEFGCGRVVNATGH